MWGVRAIGRTAVAVCVAICLNVATASAATDLTSLLVTQADFPGPGWTVMGVGDSAAAPEPPTHWDTQPPGCDNSDKMRPSSPVGLVGMNSGTGETVSVYLSHDSSIFASTRDWLTRCPSFAVTTNDANGTVHLWPTTVPGATDDQSLGYTMAMKPVGITVVTYMTTVNDIVVLATAFAQTKLDRTSLDQMFGAQVAKARG